MSRGGKREGAGRPPGPPTISISLSLYTEEYEWLKRYGWSNGLTFPQEAIRLILRRERVKIESIDRESKCD